MLREKHSEIGQWKHKYMEIEIKFADYETIIQRGRDCEERNNLLQKEIENWKSKHTKLEITINEYRGRILIINYILNYLFKNKKLMKLN